MNTVVASKPSAFGYRVVASVAVGHALVVFLLWLGVFFADVQLISGRVWLILVWLWLVWPILLALYPGRSRRGLAVPLLVGFALIAPCIPTAFVFTAWAIGGFAP